jgi:hypothetical protein
MKLVSRYRKFVYRPDLLLNDLVIPYQPDRHQVSKHFQLDLSHTNGSLGIEGDVQNYPAAFG